MITPWLVYHLKKVIVKGTQDDEYKKRKFENTVRRSDCRSSRPEVFCKKVFLEISQNSQENTCARVSFLIKLLASDHRCFPVNFVKFLRAPFFIEHLWWLLLRLIYQLTIFSHMNTYGMLPVVIIKTKTESLCLWIWYASARI